MLTAHLLTLIFMCEVFVAPGSTVKFVVPQCDRDTFDLNVENCLSDFNKSMESSGYQHYCPWPTVKRSYNQLKHCVDNSATASWCKGRGFLVDDIFLEVHYLYFTLCGQVHDPPLFTLIMLIAPVIIVTFFLPLLCVHLTTWKT